MKEVTTATMVLALVVALDDGSVDIGMIQVNAHEGIWRIGR